MRTIRLHTFAVGLAAVVVTGMLAGAPSDAAAPAPQAERISAAAKYGRDAFAATNNRRAQNDRRVFRSNACLQRYAVRNARRMANREDMDHQQMGPIMSACGLSWVGENIADNYPNGRSVVQGWMNSPPHRRNILNRNFKLMAVAARKGDNGHWYAAQVFGRKS